MIPQTTNTFYVYKCHTYHSDNSTCHITFTLHGYDLTLTSGGLSYSYARGKTTQWSQLESTGGLRVWDSSIHPPKSLVKNSLFFFFRSCRSIKGLNFIVQPWWYKMTIHSYLPLLSPKHICGSQKTYFANIYSGDWFVLSTHCDSLLKDYV